MRWLNSSDATLFCFRCSWERTVRCMFLWIRSRLNTYFGYEIHHSLSMKAQKGATLISGLYLSRNGHSMSKSIINVSTSGWLRRRTEASCQNIQMKIILQKLTKSSETIGGMLMAKSGITEEVQQRLKEGATMAILSFWSPQRSAYK